MSSLPFSFYKSLLFCFIVFFFACHYSALATHVKRNIDTCLCHENHLSIYILPIRTHSHMLAHIFLSLYVSLFFSLHPTSPSHPSSPRRPPCEGAGHMKISCSLLCPSPPSSNSSLSVSQIYITLHQYPTKHLIHAATLH